MVRTRCWAASILRTRPASRDRLELFDFVIPKSREASERILPAINRPRRDSVEAFLHAWIDTQQVRPPDSLAFAFLNDVGPAVPSDVPEAFAAYGIRQVPWSKREEVREQLVN